MRIGVIGAGHIGGTLGRLLAKAGHQIVFGVGNPAKYADLVDTLGGAARAGGLAEAAGADIVIFAGPYSGWPDFAKTNGGALVGKPVIDAANPYPERDGPMAKDALALSGGSGRCTQALLPGAHVVKAFNSVYWADLRDKAHRQGERLAMPIAGDDCQAVAITAELARDAGFDPVVVGGLDCSDALDPGSAIYAKSFTAAQVREALGLKT